MALKEEEKQIGNKTFKVIQWSASKSFLMKWELGKAFGSSLAKITDILDFDSLLSSKEEKDKRLVKEGIDIGAELSLALNKFFENNTPDDMLDLMKKVLKDVFCSYESADGRDVKEKISIANFDSIFEGDDLADCYKVAIFVLKVNYAGLLKGQKGKKLLAVVEGATK